MPKKKTTATKKTKSPAKKSPAKKATKGSKAKSKKPEYPHGRKLGPKGAQCGQCNWLDVTNVKIGNAVAPCRISRGCKAQTPACDQFGEIGQLVAEKRMTEILKGTRGKIGNAVATKAGSCITTGLLTSDLVVGGGQAPGRVYIKAGRPHSGKTTEYGESIGHALSRGVPVYHYDSEGAVDWDYTERACRRWGVQLEWDNAEQRWTHPLLFPIEFESGDEFFRWLAWTLKELDDYTTGMPSMYVIVDSAANLTPKSLADNPDANAMAAPARMFSTGFQVSRSLLKRKGAILGFTNHIKEKPGVTFGSPEYMSGGSALHHHADIVEWMRGRASGMPQPAVKSKGRRVERSWRGEGKDFYMYAAHAFKKNRKRGSATDTTWGRICFKEAGGPGTGVDRAFDVFQFLCMTGQAEWLGRERIELDIYDVQFDGEKYVHPKLEGWEEKQMSWVDFKKLVMEESLTPGSHPIDLYQHCRNQMVSGIAFEFYTEMTRDNE